jgi:ribA/ribD-fused uncharacterized protein
MKYETVVRRWQQRNDIIQRDAVIDDVTNEGGTYINTCTGITAFYTNRSELSNMYISPFTLEDREFSCVEQYYVYHKAKFHKDENLTQQIIKSNNTSKIKQISNRINTSTTFDTEGWNKIRENVMRQALRAKYEDAHCRQALLRTKDTVIYECNPNDTYWSCGLGITKTKIAEIYPGNNRLGVLLMELRNDIQ